jgi:hypothetical protein
MRKLDGRCIVACAYAMLLDCMCSCFRWQWRQHQHLSSSKAAARHPPFQQQYSCPLARLPFSGPSSSPWCAPKMPALLISTSTPLLAHSSASFWTACSIRVWARCGSLRGTASTWLSRAVPLCRRSPRSRCGSPWRHSPSLCRTSARGERFSREGKNQPIPLPRVPPKPQRKPVSDLPRGEGGPPASDWRPPSRVHTRLKRLYHGLHPSAERSCLGAAT